MNEVIIMICKLANGIDGSSFVIKLNEYPIKNSCFYTCDGTFLSFRMKLIFTSFRFFTKFKTLISILFDLLQAIHSKSSSHFIFLLHLAL